MGGRLSCFNFVGAPVANMHCLQSNVDCVCGCVCVYVCVCVCVCDRMSGRVTFSDLLIKSRSSCRCFSNGGTMLSNSHFSVTPVNSGCVFVCNVNIYHVWVYKTCTRRNTHTHSPYTHVLRLVSFYLDLFQFNFRVEHQRGGGERGGTNATEDGTNVP